MVEEKLWCCLLYTSDAADDSLRVDLGNGLREVMVIDGGNGTNWYLTATTTNLLDDVITLSLIHI